MSEKNTYSVVNNNDGLQQDGLTRAEKSKLSLVLSQTAEKLFSEKSDNNVLSDTSFVSTIRETDSTGLIQQIENRLSRKLTYQDIAEISLSGTDMLKTLDHSHLRDSTNSRKFSALARVYIQKTIEKISSVSFHAAGVKGGISKEDKTYSKKLINSYKKFISGSRENPTLEQAIGNYNDWIEENKNLLGSSKDFWQDIQIRVDDVFHQKNKNFENDNLVQDISAFGAMRQTVAENALQQDMRNEGLKMSKKIRISDLLADHFHAFEETISEADKADREEMDNAEKTKKFLSYLRSKATSADDIAMINALEEMNLHKNDLTKCSENTQGWFLKQQKNAWEKSGSYEKISSMLQKFVSISKQDMDKITNAILTKPNGKDNNVQCVIEGKPTTISIATKLRGGAYDVGESYIETWDFQPPLDITINGKDMLSINDSFPLQKALVVSAMVAHGDSMPEEEKNTLLEEVDQELRIQNQTTAKSTSRLLTPTKHTFSTEEVLKNLLASDEQKLIRAEKLCGGELSQIQKDAIITAHNVGSYKNKEDAPEEIRDTLTLHDGERYEIGKDGKTHARGRNYSQAQLKRKMEIMTKGGFSMQQATMLIRAGITGKTTREEEITLTKEDIESLDKEITEIKNALDETKRTGSIDGSAPIDLAKIKTDLRDITRQIEQLEKERANFAFEAGKPGVSPADRLHYETEAKRVADEIKALSDRQIALEEQVDPINTHITKEEKKLDAKYNKLDEKKELLKQLEKKEEKEKEEEKSTTDVEGNGGLDSSVNGLKDVWNEIKGEKGAQPQVGTSLFLREGVFENYFPKGLNAEVGNRIELRIKDVNQTTGAVTFTIHGVFKPLHDADGKKIEGNTLSPISGKQIKEQITQGSYDEVYRLKSVSDLKQRGENMKNADIDFAGVSGGLDNKHQAWLKDMRTQVDFSSMKKIKMENTSEPDAGKDIKYFGADAEFYDEESGSYKPFRLWYKVIKADGNEIILEEGGKDEKGETTRQEHSFTPQGFFFFAAENNLRPYTQGDVDGINKNSLENNAEGQEFINDSKRSSDNPPSDLMRKTAEGRGLFGLKWGSIKSVMASLKKIKKEGIDKRLDERAKKNEELVWNTMMTSKAAKWLSGANIPGISEITGMLADDVENMIDLEKTKKINEAKEEPTKKGNSGGFGPHKFIGESIFNDDPFASTTIGNKQFDYAQRNPLKVAGYFLYCYENGGPYSKALANYQETGSWVKLLLGEKYQQQYLRERAELKKEIDALPHDSADRIEKQDLVAKQDLGFIQSHFGAQPPNGSPRKKIYGEAFFPKMLGQAEAAWNAKKQLEKAESDVSDARLFDGLKTDYYNSFKTGRAAGGVGTLGKMAIKVQNNERYYYDWAGAMLFSMLSGGIKDNLVENGKEWFASLSRKYAFVPGLFVMDGNGEQQLMRLIDIIAKNTEGATPLSAYKKNTDKGPKQFKLGDMTAAGSNGLVIQERIHHPENRAVIDALMSPEKLLSVMDKLRPSDGDPTPGQSSLNDYNVVKDYLENKFMDTEESSMGNMDDVKRSVIFSKHIWSFSPALVKRLMGANNNYSNFPAATADIGPILWRKLGSGTEKMSRGIPPSKQNFQFLLKRFTQYFGLDSESQRLLIVGIKEQNLKMIHIAISGSHDKKGLGNNLHPDIARTFSLFEKVFEKGGGMYQDGDDSWLDALQGVDSWSDAKIHYRRTTHDMAMELLEKKTKNKNIEDILGNYYDD